MLEPTRPPDLGLPVASLLALRHALEADLGPDGAARALHRAGHAAGDALFTLLSTGAPGHSPAELGESEFWRRLGALFAERSWGRLAFDAVHPGIGSIESTDWAEADPEGDSLRPSCHFTAGLLANLLGRTAGEEVGVLEVECRSRGDLSCRFLFGGAPALQRLYAALRDGQDVERFLAGRA